MYISLQKTCNILSIDYITSGLLVARSVSQSCAKHDRVIRNQPINRLVTNNRY